MARLGAGPPAGQKFVTKDRWRRTVCLSERAMGHIVGEHRELDGHELLIQTAVEEADVRTRGRKDGAEVHDREVLWVRNIGPAQWFRVVVRYEGSLGRVITAYADPDGPEAAEHI